MKLRSLAVGLALLTTGTVIGVTTQQLASADVSSGDRPVLVPIESCRLVDTRPAFNVGPRTTPLGPAETTTFDTQQTGTECTGDIPTDATAIAANVTAPDSTGESFITLWASGPRPNGSTLNPQPAQLVFNAATIELDGTTFRTYNNANNVHIIIDIIGYYENHHHDDRYYTKAETNDAIAAAGIGMASGYEPGDVLFEPTFAPQRLAPATEVVTDRAGRLHIVAEYAFEVNCAPSNWAFYYLRVDGVPVENSVISVFDSDLEHRTYVGHTDEAVPAGTHSIDIAAECRPGSSWTSQASELAMSAHVLVVP